MMAFLEQVDAQGRDLEVIPVLGFTCLDFQDLAIFISFLERCSLLISADSLSPFLSCLCLSVIATQELPAFYLETASLPPATW